MSYDELGHQTLLKDPDAGITTYRYDPFGRLTYQYQDKGHYQGDVTKQVYDAYGRLQKITDYMGATLYQYEYYTTTGPELGKLKKKTTGSPYPYESYTYDALGRVLTTTKYIDASNVYTYTNTYDQAGNITKVIYPAGNIVNNEYDSYGNLSRVLFTSADGAVNNTPVWTLNTSNATTTAYTLGNGLTTTKSYDAAKGFTLSSIVTEYQSSQLQASYYDLNAVTGNLISREDRREGYKLQETFGYDGLYRLTSWSVAKNGINTFSNSMNYKTDLSGNIASKTDIGTYGYTITGKPHQISSLQLTQASFTPTAPQDITYTTFGKVGVLTDQNYKVLFTYDTDQQRCKSVMQTTTGTTLYTMYYGGAYEKKVPVSGSSTEYTYIPAGDGIAAVFIKTGTSAGTLYYIHKDHLGSITALTNSSRTIVEEYAYDPWGRRRNPADWSFTNVPVPSLIHRGFTGHEHIDEISLINMNGRIYDPVLGMFISCDNFVQSPTQSQNFNRYSYCIGNPLKYTDPDGNFFFFIAIGYALMQADIAGHASENNGGNYWGGFGKSIGVSAAGMVVGAGVGSVFGGLLPEGSSALGSTLWGGASGALSGGVTGGIMNTAMGGSFNGGFINGAIGGGLMGALGGYVKYKDSHKTYEFGIGESNLPKKILKSNANTYNEKNALTNEEALKLKMMDKWDIQKGDLDIKLITTRTGSYGLTYDGQYVNLKSRSLVAGFFDGETREFHISPATLNANDVTFEAVTGHELIHAYHQYIMPNVVTKYSERVAYKYTHNVYVSAGDYSHAFETIRSAMFNPKGLFWGAYPAQYEIPIGFRFHP